VGFFFLMCYRRFFFVFSVFFFLSAINLPLITAFLAQSGLPWFEVGGKAPEQQRWADPILADDYFGISAQCVFKPLQLIKSLRIVDKIFLGIFKITCCQRMPGPPFLLSRFLFVLRHKVTSSLIFLSTESDLRIVAVQFRLGFLFGISKTLLKNLNRSFMLMISFDALVIAAFIPPFAYSSAKIIPLFFHSIVDHNYFLENDNTFSGVISKDSNHLNPVKYLDWV